jgi:cell division protein FtsZ
MSQNVYAKPIVFTPLEARTPTIKVIGLGGGGCNTINRMIDIGVKGVEFIAANTDSQALKNSLADIRIQLGPECTRGLGSGGNPEVGRKAAEESYRDLATAMQNADMVFLTAGMGGGTGTGAISVAAQVARSIGAVTIAIVSTPFSFEIGRRQVNAREGINRLRPFTDTLITVPNDRLLQLAPRNLPLELAFHMADDVLRQGIQGISELITRPGLINVDFAHIRQVMQAGGGSVLSMGSGQGANKASQAIEKALHHPLLESISLENVSGIIANFTAGPDLSFQEVVDALSNLQARTNNQAEIIPGIITDENLLGRVEVILILTGLGATAVETTDMQKKVEPEPVCAEATPSLSMGVNRQISRPRVEVPAGSSSNLDIPAFLRRRQR